MALVVAVCSSASAQWLHQEAPIMGTRIYVELWQTDEAKASILIQKVLAEMERINQLMSPYIERSELSLVNQRAAYEPVKVSEELVLLIQKAQEYSAMSGGAFDVTVGSVGHKFNYRKGIKPSDKEWQEAKKTVDYQSVVLDLTQSTVKFQQPGVEIDLGGIAKGYAVDNSIKILQAAGVEHAIVTAGGDSRILGDHRGRPWMLGIKNPRGDEPVISLPLENVAISTSGDYERFFIQDGVRYHHIIDPKSGDSARKVLSATILADRSVDADALSTTVFVLGVDAGLELVDRLPGVSAIFIDSKGKVFYSKDLVAP